MPSLEENQIVRKCKNKLKKISLENEFIIITSNSFFTSYKYTL